MTPYAEATQGMSNLGGIVSNMALALARQRAEQAQYQRAMLLEQRKLAMQERLQGKHEALYDAQAALSRQQQSDLEKQSKAREFLGVAAGEIARGEPGDLDYDAMLPVYRGQMAEAAAQLPAREFDPTSFAQLMAMRDPNVMSAIAAGGAEKLRVDVAPGHTSFSPSGGEQYNAGYTLSPGEVRQPPTIGQQADVTKGDPRVTGGLTERDRNLRHFNDARKYLESFKDELGRYPSEGDPYYEDFIRARNDFGLINNEVMRNLREVPSRGATVNPFGGVSPLDPDLRFLAPPAPEGLPVQPPTIAPLPEANVTPMPSGMPYDQSAAFAVPRIPTPVPQLMGPSVGFNPANPGDQTNRGVYKVTDLLNALRAPGEFIPTDQKPKKKHSTTEEVIVPKTHEEFDNLPPGTLFKNPADGRIMRKK